MYLSFQFTTPSKET